jgi:hypothetical protein
MRIDLVNGATYSPVRITPKQKTEAGQIPQAVKPQKMMTTPSKLSLEGLSPQEANLLQQLFGDFNKVEKSDTPKSLRPGQFIDITA